MGYVGAAVVKHLRTTYPDMHLTGYDSGLFSHCVTSDEPIPETMLNDQVFGDIRDLPRRVLDGIDAVVHLGAVSNDPMGHRFEDVTHSINHHASVSVAKAAAAAGVKTFVFASSCSVYGAAGEARPRTEDDPVNPLTAYAISKIAAETSLRAEKFERMKVRCLRFATACGMSARLRLDLVLNDFVACALATRQITVLSDGTPWRPLIDVTDMALAIDWAVMASERADPFLVVNVGRDDWNWQVKDLAQAVAEAIPGTAVSINVDAPSDKRSYLVSFARFAHLAPDHIPRSSLPESIAHLRDGLTSIGFADPDFRSSDLIRLRVLDRLIGRQVLSSNLRLLV